MALKFVSVCNFCDFIQEIVDITGKDYNVVENGLARTGLYPENTTIFLSLRRNEKMEQVLSNIDFDEFPEYIWLHDVIVQVFKNNNLVQMGLNN